jgi:aryl-alcohol dehydrogenase-like predicted oxidoreductase
MRTQRQGSMGPEISVIGFGAWEARGMAWGPNPPDRQTIDAIGFALDAGITWIDTAEVYGGGRSEELVGAALDGRDALVFTKVAPKPAGSGFHAAGVREAASKSLERLGRVSLDLLQLHWPDRSTRPLSHRDPCAPRRCPRPPRSRVCVRGRRPLVTIPPRGSEERPWWR